ncbi:MAG: hypothetical protein VXZ72_04885, partial [Chlamydiota bacterium]|nr:hypothetical protein [Chlamydiota bacterium]
MPSPSFLRQYRNLLMITLLSFSLLACRLLMVTMQEVKRPPPVKEAPPAAAIWDRQGIPLAIQRGEYFLTFSPRLVTHAALREWQGDPHPEEGMRKIRQRYLHALSCFLEERVGISSSLFLQEVEGEGRFATHPLLIAQDLGESLYAFLLAHQREWPGLAAERHLQRHYPQGDVAGDLLGYIGRRSPREEERIEEALEALDIAIQRHGELPLLPGYSSLGEMQRERDRLSESLAYHQPLVGKSGLEASLGHRLSQGEEITLTLSAELQAYAEELLRISEGDRSLHTQDKRLPPWIRGGAIIAAIPKTGEIVAMASHPHIDPNAFIRRETPSVERYLESEHHIASIWEGLLPLGEGGEALSWSHYLERVLSPGCQVGQALAKIGSIGEAQQLLSHYQKLEKRGGSPLGDLLAAAPPWMAHAPPLGEIDDPRDRLLLLDLLRLLMPS